ncbi:hypothetical protein AHAS_Ahas11G0181800 [Arachis hypogaea]
MVPAKTLRPSSQNGYEKDYRSSLAVREAQTREFLISSCGRELGKEECWDQSSGRGMVHRRTEGARAPVVSADGIPNTYYWVTSNVSETPSRVTEEHL